jgi:hypothetical protein
MEYSRYLEHHEKTKPTNHGYRRGTGDKGIDNLFNRLIAEYFLNLKRELLRCRSLTEHQTIRTKRETHPDTLYSKYSAHRTKKKKRQVTYKGKSIRITADFSTQTVNARRS